MEVKFVRLCFLVWPKPSLRSIVRLNEQTTFLLYFGVRNTRYCIGSGGSAQALMHHLGYSGPLGC